MRLKDCFISYCELQRAADEAFRAYGPNDNQVVKMFETANDMKRFLLNQLEEIDENRNFKWYPLWHP